MNESQTQSAVRRYRLLSHALASAKATLFALEAEDWNTLGEPERQCRSEEADTLVAEIDLVSTAMEALERTVCVK